MKHDDLGNYSHTYVNELRAENTKLRDQRDRLVRFVKQAMDFVDYRSEDDEVGNFHCCGSITYRGHSDRCEFRAILAEIGEGK